MDFVGKYNAKCSLETGSPEGRAVATVVPRLQIYRPFSYHPERDPNLQLEGWISWLQEKSIRTRGLKNERKTVFKERKEKENKSIRNLIKKGYSDILFLFYCLFVSQ